MVVGRGGKERSLSASQKRGQSLSAVYRFSCGENHSFGKGTVPFFKQAAFAVRQGSTARLSPRRSDTAGPGGYKFELRPGPWRPGREVHCPGLPFDGRRSKSPDSAWGHGEARNRYRRVLSSSRPRTRLVASARRPVSSYEISRPDRARFAKTTRWVQRIGNCRGRCELLSV